MKQMNVGVNLDSGLSGPNGTPNMDVDLVALTPLEYDSPVWKNLSMNDYWKTGGMLRQDCRHYRYTIKFDPSANSATLPADDPIWEVWRSRNAKWLVVLSQLPGKHADAEANSAERLDLPLEAYRWNSHGVIQSITLTILSSQISVMPEFGPEVK